MPAAARVLSVLHLGVAVAFVGMLTAIVNRLRIGRLLLVRRAGPLTPFPIGPSLFLVFVGGGVALAEGLGGTVPLSVMIGYPAGGFFWIVATWLARTVVASEYGLVNDLPRLHRTGAWNQIVDSAGVRREGRPHVVFFYWGEDERHHRLDLPVPEEYAGGVRPLL